MDTVGSFSFLQFKQDQYHLIEMIIFDLVWFLPKNNQTEIL
jgi:hypothetical protein